VHSGRRQLNAHAGFFPRECVQAAACWPPSEVLLYVFVGFMISLTMTERVDQRYCITFCHKLGDSQSETIRKIQQVFGDDAMGVTQIKEWFNRFKNGRTSVESEQRSGRP